MDRWQRGREEVPHTASRQSSKAPICVCFCLFLFFFTIANSFFFLMKRFVVKMVAWGLVNRAAVKGVEVKAQRLVGKEAAAWRADVDQK